jgi:4-hydroxy-tetrahydrodipicolinate synthase
MHTDLAPHGLFVPLISPLTTAKELATDALAELAHDVLADGADGIVALGTTAETATLTEYDRHRILQLCGQACREHGAMLIAGAGGNDTRRTVDELHALRAYPEVAAALVPVPYYTRPGEAAVVAHFAELTARCELPLIVYNIPYRSGQTLSAATLRALAELRGVAGVKQAVGGIDAATMEFLATRPRGFAVLAGDDAFASALLALGADGGILASAHLRTSDFVALVDAWRAGDVVRARELGHELSGLSSTLFAEPNPTVIKAVLHAQGRIPTPDVRLPLLPASPDAVAAALAVCPQSGVRDVGRPESGVRDVQRPKTRIDLAV